ncbi:MAG: hypothetical protein QM749_06510 [Aquabacterium sp.]
MTPKLKSFAATALLALGGLASAQNVTFTQGDNLNPNTQLQFAASYDFVNVLGLTASQFASVGPATVSTSVDNEGFLDTTRVTAPLSSLTGQGSYASFETQSLTTRGGLLLNVPSQKSVSTGGALAITNISLDLASKQVYADLDGANGVGSLTHFHLWDIGTISGDLQFSILAIAVGCTINSCVPYGAPAVPLSFTAGDLTLAAGSFNVIAQSLGLSALGKTALASVSDFGTLTAGPVPEASSGLMMALGLIGVAGATLSRRFPSCRHSSLA